MTNDLIKKVEKFGRELEDVSLDTVKMFYNDALSSGYEL
jgi:transaldolase